MKRLLILLILLPGIAVSSVSRFAFAAIEESGKEPEAREWLKSSVSAQAGFFDSPRGSFLNRHETERLILKLYDAGALWISVVILAAQPQGFRVQLPEDPLRRADIFELVNQTLERAGFSLVRDTGQDDIVIWIVSDSYE